MKNSIRLTLMFFSGYKTGGHTLMKLKFFKSILLIHLALCSFSYSGSGWVSSGSTKPGEGSTKDAPALDGPDHKKGSLTAEDLKKASIGKLKNLKIRASPVPTPTISPNP